MTQDASFRAGYQLAIAEALRQLASLRGTSDKINVHDAHDAIVRLRHQEPPSGPGVHVRLHATVDPCGRVLVGEIEKLCPGETWQTAPRWWHTDAACVTHTIDLVLPQPFITTPRIAYRPEVARGSFPRGAEELDE